MLIRKILMNFVVYNQTFVTKSEHLHADEIIVVFVLAVLLVVTVIRHNRNADHGLRVRKSPRLHFHPEGVFEKGDFRLEYITDA